jgi:hypothetical protein
MMFFALKWSRAIAGSVKADTLSSVYVMLSIPAASYSYSFDMIAIVGYRRTVSLV